MSKIIIKVKFGLSYCQWKIYKCEDYFKRVNTTQLHDLIFYKLHVVLVSIFLIVLRHFLYGSMFKGKVTLIRYEERRRENNTYKVKAFRIFMTRDKIIVFRKNTLLSDSFIHQWWTIIAFICILKRRKSNKSTFLLAPMPNFQTERKECRVKRESGSGFCNVNFLYLNSSACNKSNSLILVKYF